MTRTALHPTNTTASAGTADLAASELALRAMVELHGPLAAAQPGAATLYRAAHRVLVGPTAYAVLWPHA